MTLDRIKSLCKFYKGRDVIIIWCNQDWDWPTYKILDVDSDREGVTLQGIATPRGDKHEGDINEYPIAEILSIKSIQEWTGMEFL